MIHSDWKVFYTSANVDEYTLLNNPKSYDKSGLRTVQNNPKKDAKRDLAISSFDQGETYGKWK